MTALPEPGPASSLHRPALRSNVTRVGIAIAVATAFAALALTSSTRAPAAPPTNFAAGSLIIPMDADTSGNHASFNQNLGMWKAYGLVYKLLQNGIPVRWGIKEAKTAITDVDFSATSVRDKRTGTALGAWDYRGGPFIIDSADAAARAADHQRVVGGEREPAERARGARGVQRRRERDDARARRGSRTRRSTRASRWPTTTPPGSPT